MTLSSPSLSLSLVTTLIAALLTAAHSQPATTYPNCGRTFSCGHITNVTFPFTGGDRPPYCGLPDFGLTCRDNTTTELTHNSVAYRVLQLDQTRKTLILSRSDLYNNACPTQFRNTTLNSTLFFYNPAQNEPLSLFYGCNTSGMSVRPYNLFSCNSSRFNFTDSYSLIGPAPSDPVMRIIYCSTSISVPLLTAAANQLMNRSVSLGEALMQGFTVSYSVPHEEWCSECNRFGGQCGFDSIMGLPICYFPLSHTPNASPAPDASFEGSNRSRKNIVIVVLLCITGVVIAAIMMFCFIKRRYSSKGQIKRESIQYVEKFLVQHGSLAPKKYKYSQIKKITKSFSDKLGKGGYGSVYKGMLPDGSLVAVKVLMETESNGEEFINEVASISRTSHVNIVSLLGFCYEGSKRALIYEYMPNKSLDKFLSNKAETDCSLDLQKLFEISVGIAKGLEYLHTGCSTRIVHFDIKPQNILLDQDLCPKISDFGLAKLCKKKQSVLSLMGTRGTIGYIAPEVFSRNFGGVSHKSDVYSYGMMVLEMVGAKNVDENHEVAPSSENYFPDKIYEQVILDVTRKVDDLMIEEETRRKMFLIGFWCIQTIPSDRPSMSKVGEMLEGSLQSIQIPPKPFLFTPNLPNQEFSSTFSAFVETENSAQDLIQSNSTPVSCV